MIFLLYYHKIGGKFYESRSYHIAGKADPFSADGDLLSGYDSLDRVCACEKGAGYPFLPVSARAAKDSVPEEDLKLP
jgi:hypothetical protein